MLAVVVAVDTITAEEPEVLVVVQTETKTE